MGGSNFNSLLGFVAESQGDPTRARRCYEERLAIYREMGDNSKIAECLNDLGIAAGKQGDYGRAVRLQRASTVLGRAFGAHPPPDEGSLSTARERLGAERYDSAWTAGEAMTMEEAIAYALTNPPASS